MNESLGFIEAACGRKFQILDRDGVYDQDATGERVRRHTGQCDSCLEVNSPEPSE